MQIFATSGKLKQILVFLKSEIRKIKYEKKNKREENKYSLECVKAVTYFIIDACLLCFSATFFLLFCIFLVFINYKIHLHFT